jgi:uncharacterized protein YukE
MPKILAVTDAMRSDAKSILAKATEIQASHNDMASVAGGMAPYFKGALPELLTQVLLDMKKKHKALYEKIVQHSKDIDDAAGKYDWSEQEIAGWANRLGVSIGALAGGAAGAAEGTTLIGGGWEKLQKKLKYDKENLNGEGKAFVATEVEKNKGEYIKNEEGEYIRVGKDQGNYNFSNIRQCKEYASELIAEATGKGLPSTEGTYGYKYQNWGEYGLEEVISEGKRSTEGSITKEELYKWFQDKQVQKGDVIQIGNNYNRVHTAIVDRIDEQGVYVIDANFGSPGKIQGSHRISWDYLAEYYLKAQRDANKKVIDRMAGISVYRPAY